VTRAHTIDFDQIDIVVADMDATLAFYRGMSAADPASRITPPEL
jgi:hypothetical protein